MNVHSVLHVRLYVKCALVVGVCLSSGRALAQNKYLCCDLTAGATSTACVAQQDTCAQKGPYSVMIEDLDISDAEASDIEAWVNPGALNGSFPDGTDGYLYWSRATPHVGFCLVAPVPADPTHVSQQDPIGCLAVTLKPGVSGEMANVVVPVDARWDGYQFCYGSPDGVNGCQNLNDGWDTTVSQTPRSHSCCGPVQMFTEHGNDVSTWVFGASQELPGVPPAVLIEQADAGIVPFFNDSAGDMYVSSADAGCLTAFNETATCGTIPVDAASPSPRLGAADKADGGASVHADAAQARAAQGGGCTVVESRPGIFAALWGFAALVFEVRRTRRRRG